jgi:8-hydroxy-5-deazaflavin:NADPH oxidoreductase
MDITVIGTGNMARGIATRALAGGHSVGLLGADADKAQSLADELSGEARAGTVGDPLTSALVVLAIWYPEPVRDILAKYDGQLDGKVVVDITNPIDPDAFVPLKIEAGSVAQEIAATAPGAKVVKAFNTTFAGTLVGGEVAGQPLDVLVASDDEEAKSTVKQLIADGGLRPVDAGPLARAHELEALGFLHMALQAPLGTQYGSTIKILT